MKFQIKVNYYTKNMSYPVRCSYFIELPKWNMTEAKNKVKSMNSQITKVEITDHKEL